MNFSEKLQREMLAKQTPVLMGLDPRVELIPEDCFDGSKRDDKAVGQAFWTFGKRLIEALAPHIAAVKPQIAFYENWGLPGLEAYQRILSFAKEKGVLSIADIKRGDIGSTSEAYAQAHLGGESGPGPFEADAVTINPWLGRDSLEPYFERCLSRGKGVYLLLHTSNPGSKDLQEKELSSGKAMYLELAEMIHSWQESLEKDAGYSSIGAVVGATFPEQLKDLQTLMPRTPFLIPGYGSQGGKGEDLAFLYQEGIRPHLINASRSLTYAYRELDVSLEEGALKAVEIMKKDILRS